MKLVSPGKLILLGCAWAYLLPTIVLEQLFPKIILETRSNHRVGWVVSLYLAYFMQSGIIYMRVNENEKAEECFGRIVIIYPQCPEGYYWLASLYKKTNKSNAATDMCHKALQIDPDFAEALFLLGLLHMEHKHDYEGAESLFRRCVNGCWWYDRRKGRNLGMGALCSASAMVDWQNQDFSGAKRDFENSGKYYRLARYTRSANFSEIFSEVVAIDAHFESLRYEDSLQTIIRETRKLYLQIEMICTETSFKSNLGLRLLRAKRDVFLALWKILQTNELREDLLKNAKEVLREMKFEKGREAIDAVLRFGKQLKFAVERCGTINALPDTELRALLDILRPMFPIMDGMLSRHASSQELKNDFKDMVSQVRLLRITIGQEARRTRAGVAKLAEEFKKKLHSQTVAAETQSKAKPISAPVRKDYEIHTKGKGRSATEKDLRLLEKKKTTYDIWFNDYRMEILVKGKPMTTVITGETRHLLRLFLENVGSYCTYDEIEQEIWTGDPPEKADGAIQRIKHRLCGPGGKIKVLRPYVEGKTGTYYINIKPERVKKELKYCLIRKSKESESIDSGKATKS